MKPLVEAGLYATNYNERKKNLSRYLFGLFSPQSILMYAKYLVKERIYSIDKNKSKRFKRLSLYMLVLCMVIASDWYWNTHYCYFIIIFWIIPLITTHAIHRSFCELLEHYPLLDPAVDDKIDIHMSKNRISILISKLFFGIHGEDYHLVHHLFPMVPSWKHKVAHNILLEDKAYAEL